MISKRFLTVDAKVIKEGRRLVLNGRVQKAIDLVLGEAGLDCSGPGAPAFVAGASRVGKTLAGQALVDRGYRLMPMDGFRFLYYRSTEGYAFVPNSHEIRARFYARLFDAGSDLIVEGTDVMFHLRQKGTIPDCNPLFFLGIHEEDITMKAQQMLQSAGHDHNPALFATLAQTIEHARSIAARSEIMRKEARQGVNRHFIDMMSAGDDILLSAQAAAARIDAILRQRGRRPARSGNDASGEDGAT